MISIGWFYLNLKFRYMIELDPKFQELMKSRKPNALLTDFVNVKCL